MDKRYFLELTNRLYGLSFFFPQKEPLRNKIREVADEILASLTIILEGENKERRESAFVVEGDIEILNTLLELAKSQNWVESREIDKIQEDYLKIKEEIVGFNSIIRQKEEKRENVFQRAIEVEEKKPKSLVKRAVKDATTKKKAKLNKRQEKIIDLLKKREKMQVKDFQEVLPTTKRTLRRDLSSLVDQRFVRRVGSGNATYYSKIGQQG